MCDSQKTCKYTRLYHIIFGLLPRPMHQQNSPQFSFFVFVLLSVEKAGHAFSTTVLFFWYAVSLSPSYHLIALLASRPPHIIIQICYFPVYHFNKIVYMCILLSLMGIFLVFSQSTPESTCLSRLMPQERYMSRWDVVYVVMLSR